MAVELLNVETGTSMMSSGGTMLSRVENVVPAPSVSGLAPASRRLRMRRDISVDVNLNGSMRRRGKTDKYGDGRARTCA